MSEIAGDFGLFCRVHEVLGDSFLLMVGSTWWTKLKLHGKHIKILTAHIATIFAYKLNCICSAVESTVSMRIGISYGPITGTVQKNSGVFRIFGPVINETTRLESVCKEGCVTMMKDFYNDIVRFIPSCDLFKSFEIIEILQSSNLNVEVHDPYLSSDSVNLIPKDTCLSDLKSKKYSGVIFCVAHDQYNDLDVLSLVSNPGVIFDLKKQFKEINSDFCL